MELKITGFGDKGDLKNERIGFQVIKDCDLKYFLLFKTNFTETSFYNRANAAFWFSSKNVKAGDKLVVYTRIGTDNVVANNDGTTTYFIYWGLNEPIFTDVKHGVVLTEVKTWELSRNF